MELLHNIDFELFSYINQEMTNAFFDLIMPIFRNKNTWIPLYILLFAYLIYKQKTKAWIVIVLAIVSIILADGISSHILKPFVERLRPCNVPELSNYLILRVNHCSGGFSFPSSHAANHFALATFIGLALYQNSKWFLRIGLLWAAIISFAQVYVGVHFPIDVFFGGILGLSIGWFLFKIPYAFLKRKF